METDQAEQLDAFFNQSAKMLNKNHDNEETDTSTTSKEDSGSPPPFDSKDTQKGIVMAEKRDTNSITSKQQLEMTGPDKSNVEPQK